MATIALTRDQIVAEALALLKSGGLEEVSLRKIAGRLGIKAPSLYWHVPSKEALYGLMAEAIFRACLADVPPGGDWRTWLHNFGLSLWRAQRAVPDIRQLIVRGSLSPDSRDSMLGEVLAELTARGLKPEIALPAQRSVQALVTGWQTLKSGRDDGAEAAFLQGLDALIDGWTARA